ncbi:cytochrome c oxidase subunit cyclope [Ptiloglossa arizonensis]|uniref:cytochrome c oxidase subunit cyclope n=1 Tax=Ptiloglossa arizonensis TaxID=3350558 RepID=UPI003F9F315D
MSEVRLAKPQLRNLHMARAKRTLPMVMAGTLAVGLVCKILMCDRFENRLEEFYKTYDAEATFKKIQASGFMDSCK